MTRRFDSLCLLAVWIWLWLLPLEARAQTQAQAQTENATKAFLEILNINTHQFPQVAVTVSTANWSGDIQERTPTLWENNQIQMLTAEEIQQVGLEVMLVIDANQIAAVNGAGQSHYDALVNVVFAMVEQNTVTRKHDQLAAYAIDEADTLKTIQGWTDEPNLLFNQIVQNRPATVTTERPITGGLQLALEQFPTPATPPAARSLILFSVGTTVAPLEAVAEVITKANARDVHIHVIEWNAAEQLAPANELLQQLATATHGLHLALQAPVPSSSQPSFQPSSQLALLWEHLSAQRFQRVLTYQSSAVGLETIRVDLRLPDGTQLTDSRSLSDLDLHIPNQMHAANQEETAALSPSIALAPAPAIPPAEMPSTADEQPPAEEVSDANRLAIPGTSLSLPYRTAVAIISLLLLLLIYLLYEEIQQHRMRSAAAASDIGEEMDPFHAADAIYQLIGPPPAAQAQEYQENHLLTYQNGFTHAAAQQFAEQHDMYENGHPDPDKAHPVPVLEERHAAEAYDRMVEQMPERAQPLARSTPEAATHFAGGSITYV